MNQLKLCSCLRNILGSPGGVATLAREEPRANDIDQRAAVTAPSVIKDPEPRALTEDTRLRDDVCVEVAGT